MLALFILTLIKTECGGFLSPGLGGYCGEEIGDCGGSPPPPHPPLGWPTKSCLTPFPQPGSCSHTLWQSCGHDCGCRLVKRRREDSKLQIQVRREAFPSITTRGYSSHSETGGGAPSLGVGVCSYLLYRLSIFFTGSLREVVCEQQQRCGA